MPAVSRLGDSWLKPGYESCDGSASASPLRYLTAAPFADTIAVCRTSFWRPLTDPERNKRSEARNG